MAKGDVAWGANREMQHQRGYLTIGGRALQDGEKLGLRRLALGPSSVLIDIAFGGGKNVDAFELSPDPTDARRRCCRRVGIPIPVRGTDNDPRERRER